MTRPKTLRECTDGSKYCEAHLPVAMYGLNIPECTESCLVHDDDDMTHQETLHELRERLNSEYIDALEAQERKDWETFNVCNETVMVEWPRISKALEKMLQWIEDHRCEAEFCSQCRDLLASLNRGE